MSLLFCSASSTVRRRVNTIGVPNESRGCAGSWASKADILATVPAIPQSKHRFQVVISPLLQKTFSRSGVMQSALSRLFVAQRLNRLHVGGLLRGQPPKKEPGGTRHQKGQHHARFGNGGAQIAGQEFLHQ